MLVASRRGRYSSGQETRLLLVETAERLFAMRGYHPVTLADVRAAAGQNNASVVRYYFGSKEGLLTAILDHRLPRISAYRGELIVSGSRSVRHSLRGMHCGVSSSLWRTASVVASITWPCSTGSWRRRSSARPSSRQTPVAPRVDSRSTAYCTALSPIFRKTHGNNGSSWCTRVCSERSRSTPAQGPNWRRPSYPLVDAWEGLLCAPTSEETRETRALAGR